MQRGCSGRYWQPEIFEHAHGPLRVLQRLCVQLLVWGVRLLEQGITYLTIWFKVLVGWVTSRLAELELELVHLAVLAHLRITDWQGASSGSLIAQMLAIDDLIQVLASSLLFEFGFFYWDKRVNTTVILLGLLLNCLLNIFIDLSQKPLATLISR